ncbi:MAG: 30S ribosomal protein S16 [Kiritimatiellia bacterium]
MAVIIRCRRTGANNDPSFRIVATDERSPRDGKYLEGLGWYDPKKKEKNFLLKLERIELWLKNGAKISPIVQTLVNKARRGITSSTSKKPRKKGGAKAAPAAQAQEPKKADEPKKEAPAAPAADVKK